MLTGGAVGTVAGDLGLATGAGVTRFPKEATRVIGWNLEGFGEISNDILVPIEPFILALRVRVVIFG